MMKPGSGMLILVISVGLLMLNSGISGRSLAGSHPEQGPIKPFLDLLEMDPVDACLLSCDSCFRVSKVFFLIMIGKT